jgi:hypothetical protein
MSSLTRGKSKPLQNILEYTIQLAIVLARVTEINLQVYRCPAGHHGVSRYTQCSYSTDVIQLKLQSTSIQRIIRLQQAKGLILAEWTEHFQFYQPHSNRPLCGTSCIRCEMPTAENIETVAFWNMTHHILKMETECSFKNTTDQPYHALCTLSDLIP